ncbi:hypothetical protein AB0D12_33980 [Streptomyces sp. NPDC048479]|uniref:hypothetical protein n=1 Tax=Streptomyces sp. NPDC048479 TaxID=3154725 RepID=UPI00341D51C7
MFEVVTPGGLNVTAPTAAVLSSAAPGGTASGHLGEVRVIDERAAPDAQWIATVALSQDFTTGGGRSNETISGGGVDYDPGAAIDPVNGPFIPGPPGTLANSRVAFRHASGSGSNSVAWDPTLDVHVPAPAVAGTYHGTVTHSVA